MVTTDLTQKNFDILSAFTTCPFCLMSSSFFRSACFIVNNIPFISLYGVLVNLHSNYVAVVKGLGSFILSFSVM